MRRIVAAEYLSLDCVTEELIDEYRFMIYPLVLETDKRFFRHGGDKTALTLERAETASSGVTMLVCEPA